MVIEFNRLLEKGLQRIYNSLFICLSIYLFFYLFEVNFLNPARNRMLNLHMSAVLVAKIHFPLNQLILQFRPFFHFDNQSLCWLIFYPEQSSEENLRVKRYVEYSRHENVVKVVSLLTISLQVQTYM